MNDRDKGFTPEQIAERRKKKLPAAVIPPRVGSPGTPVFHCPLTRCNFSSWLRFDSLPVHQACFVMLGFEPPPLELLMSREVVIDKPPLYFDLLGSLKVSIANASVPSSLVVDGAYKITHVTLTDLVTWAASKAFPVDTALNHLIEAPQPAPVISVTITQPALEQTATPAEALGTARGVETDKAGPLSLTTGDIAFCFAGLRWKTEKAWKKPLGDKPKWLAACIVIPGVQGVSESRWSPVCIGAALVRAGHVKPNSVRAKFQTQPLLTPWLDEWKTYEADNSDSI